MEDSQYYCFYAKKFINKKRHHNKYMYRLILITHNFIKQVL
ncbi:hypothetical protein CNEO4_1000049 [Clostridium neonatale]|uniref:Uncharacterized protein n=1 Tax=Clostridium neonatale TaxID=137838 RepID=A0AA86MP93_9CLOT|nr:hypothetical protein CNEO_42889 [Clostridium neonatale]CAG9711916.1 hypothetical protein CNEO_430019 [Clostridium neonatale]CAG9716456.1 hypothetical protein CNEO_390098 [Clostridium neonatale]CAI3205608.1 hypothetical protein CNEO2_340049 [Clostridium neonatale]CAI3209697.1 hypothetical protein CNEO2_420033 [Clostridium neonatale]